MTPRKKRRANYLCVQSYDTYYKALIPDLKKIVCEGKNEIEVLTQNNIQIYHRLGRGNRQPPQKIDHIWTRILGILRRLVENPCGVKTVRRMYLRKRKGKSLIPPRMHPANGSFIRRILRLLKSKGLLESNSTKGYYTTTQGKELLKSKIDAS